MEICLVSSVVLTADRDMQETYGVLWLQDCGASAHLLHFNKNMVQRIFSSGGR
jgi:hypothetical protein